MDRSHTLDKGVTYTSSENSWRTGEFLQFAEDGERGIGAECSFEFWQISDFVTAEMLTEDGGIESRGSHNVIVPTRCSF